MKQINIDDLVPYERNAKIHNDEQIDALAKIVKEVGWRQPVIVNQKGVIIVVHGRYMAWQKFKDELKPIWVIDDKGKTIHGEIETKPLTDQQEAIYRIADNKLNESPWDFTLLNEDLKLLSLEEQTLTGFTTEALENLNEDVTLESPEKEKKIKKVFEVIVECADEGEQERVFNQLENMGLKVRLIAI